MNDSQPSRLALTTPVGCILMLFGVVALVSVVVIPIMLLLGVEYGLISVVAAAGLCLVCGIAAVVALFTFHNAGSVLIGALVGMGFRFVPPLVVCLVLALNRLSFPVEPFVYSLLVYYTATLAVEVWLATQLLQSSTSALQNSNQPSERV